MSAREVRGLLLFYVFFLVLCGIFAAAFHHFTGAVILTNLAILALVWWICAPRR